MDRIISHIFGIKKVKIKNYEYEYSNDDVVSIGNNNDKHARRREIYDPHQCLQNVYLGDEVTEEPDFEYVPESSLVGGLGTSLAAGGAAHQNASMTSTCSSQNIVGLGGQTAALSQSMMLLDESLISGAIVGQFEQLYRR